jgi:thiamine biosynthesis lipoprotein
VQLAQGGQVALRSRALATSAPLGTTFDQAGTLGHILDPRSGLPAAPVWRAASISAPSAALADALSTAACLTKVKGEVQDFCNGFAGTRIESLIPA